MRTREEIKEEHQKVCDERLKIEFTIDKLLREEETCNNRINELMQEMINLVNSEKG